MNKCVRSLMVLFVAVGVLAMVGTVVLAGLPAEPLTILNCKTGQYDNITVRTEPGPEYACPTKAGGSYTYAIIASPSTLNPVTASDTASDSISDHIFGTFYTGYSLLGAGAQGTDPQVASVINVSKDGTTVTYTLRKGLVYSDGSPVTTDDILYWYRNVVWDPNLPNSNQDSFTCTDGSPFVVTSPAANQIQVHCPQPFRTYTGVAGAMYVMSKPMALELIKSQGIATQKIIGPGPNGVLDTKPAGDDKVSGPDIGAGKDGTLNTTPAGDDTIIEVPTQEFLGLGVNLKQLRGLGPFVLSSFQSDSLAKYARNPNFYESDSNGTQLPYLNSLQIVIIPTAGFNLALSDFLNGTTDEYGPRPQDISVILSQAAAGGFGVNQDINTGIANAGETFVTPNFDDPDPNLAAVARNPAVRKALFLAIDRASLVNNVLLGIGTPQLNPVTISGTSGSQFFSGRNNTCATFIKTGLADASSCTNGVWTLSNGLPLTVTNLPDPSNADVAEELSCLNDFAGCLTKAGAMLDAAGIKLGADGVRQIPANFDPVVKNPGGAFSVQIVTNTGNTIRVEMEKVVCNGWNQIGVKCSAVTTSFPTLVHQLLGGTFTGYILIGLTGGDPAGAANVIRCGTFLHMWHVSCDPTATSGLTAPTADEVILDKDFAQGRSATDVAGAQVGFDKEQTDFAKYVPYYHLAAGNALFAERTDRISNTGGAINANDDVKFRCDLPGQQPSCNNAPHQ